MKILNGVIFALLLTAQVMYSQNIDPDLNNDLKSGSGICTDNLYSVGCYMSGTELGLSYWELAGISTDIVCEGNPDWYHDFTNLNHQLAAGEPYTLKIIANGGVTIAYEYFEVWIDFNDDLQLTDDEIVLDDALCIPAHVLKEYEMTIPDDANPGSHVMRMRSRSLESQPVKDPCETYTYGSCCDFMATILPAGLNESHPKTALVYPNPGDGLFTLSTRMSDNSPANVTVFDGMGRQVYYRQNVIISNSNPSLLDLQDLPEGIYFLYVDKCNDDWYFSKVLIQK